MIAGPVIAIVEFTKTLVGREPDVVSRIVVTSTRHKKQDSLGQAAPEERAGTGLLVR